MREVESHNVHSILKFIYLLKNFIIHSICNKISKKGFGIVLTDWADYSCFFVKVFGKLFWKCFKDGDFFRHWKKSLLYVFTVLLLVCEIKEQRNLFLLSNYILKKKILFGIPFFLKYLLLAFLYIYLMLLFLHQY